MPRYAPKLIDPRILSSFLRLLRSSVIVFVLQSVGTSHVDSLILSFSTSKQTRSKLPFLIPNFINIQQKAWNRMNYLKPFQSSVPLVTTWSVILSKFNKILCNKFIQLLKVRLGSGGSFRFRKRHDMIAEIKCKNPIFRGLDLTTRNT